MKFLKYTFGAVFFAGLLLSLSGCGERQAKFFSISETNPITDSVPLPTPNGQPDNMELMPDGSPNMQPVNDPNALPSATPMPSPEAGNDPSPSPTAEPSPEPNDDADSSDSDEDSVGEASQNEEECHPMFQHTVTKKLYVKIGDKFILVISREKTKIKENKLCFLKKDRNKVIRIITSVLLPLIPPNHSHDHH